MDLIFVAMGVHPPWTEGRKNLVRDLTVEFESRGMNVMLLTGKADAPQWLQATSVLLELGRLLLWRRASHVVQFPHGRFRGWRGWFNRALATLVRHGSSMRGLRALTVLYSADGITLAQALRRYGDVAVIGAHPRSGVYPIHLGTRMPGVENHLIKTDEPVRLLFLCGYQHATDASINGVLEERGLLRLLQACSGMDRDVSLTIAIPFLRDANARTRIEQLANTLCPSMRILLDGNTSPVAALASHTIFIFPYVTEHEVFVPTSMLEAMLVGIPVVACDRRMYRDLTCSGNEARCGLPAEDNAEGLRRELQNCIDNLPVARMRAARAREDVRREWTVERAADDLLAALGSAGQRRPN
jgi:glycosyltransferase involved in cell wall biosynthesis